MKRIFLIVLFFSGSVLAQDNRIAQFAVWEPKEGMATDFQRGYQRHLQWHKTAGDTWEWYGWYIRSGPRFGQFVDATFNHSWADFDSPVDPEGDRADNQLNVYPFGYVRTTFKAFYLKDQSIATSASLRSKMLRMVTISVTDMPSAIKIIDRYKNSLRSNSDVSTLMALKVVDGGNANQIILLIGANSWEQFGKTENIQDQLAAIESGLKLKTTIDRITSETLIFQQDMSLVPE
ncbi:MAG: hypothetical protein HOP17_11655 [Acidobacteria bacterium]|nr:hypothetical protein [Acidobacteriota bacterium]